MTYTIKYSYGHYVHTIDNSGYVSRVGERIMIERVLLDQNKTNIVNVTYFTSDGKQYKEADLYTDRVEARAECLRRNREIRFV